MIHADLMLNATTQEDPSNASVQEEPSAILITKVAAYQWNATAIKTVLTPLNATKLTDYPNVMTFACIQLVGQMPNALQLITLVTAPV